MEIGTAPKPSFTINGSGLSFFQPSLYRYTTSTRQEYLLHLAKMKHDIDELIAESMEVIASPKNLEHLLSEIKNLMVKYGEDTKTEKRSLEANSQSYVG